MWSWCYCSVLDRNYNLTSVNSNLFPPKSKSVTISAIFKNLYISSAKLIPILALTEAQVQTQRYGDCRKAYPGAIHVQILLQVFTKGSKINNWMYFHSKSVTISAIFKNVYISFAKLIPILALKVTHQLRGPAITAKLTLEPRTYKSYCRCWLQVVKLIGNYVLQNISLFSIYRF